MNLRILKKLSKRAAPIIVALGDTREQFRAEKHENYTKAFITARKHWERFSGVHPSNYPPRNIQRGEFYFKARSGRVVRISNHYVHARKGTVMVGGMSGYYEPEWDEETAWDALTDWVHAHFTTYTNGEIVLTRKIVTVGDVFRAAADILAGTPAAME